MTEYHQIRSCNKCTGFNEIEVTDSVDGHVSEADTTCVECGHKDYWAYGFFMSSEYMESKCEKYSFRRRIIDL